VNIEPTKCRRFGNIDLKLHYSQSEFRWYYRRVFKTESNEIYVNYFLLILIFQILILSINPDMQFFLLNNNVFSINLFGQIIYN